MSGNYVEEFVAFLGWEVDPKGLDKFKKQTEDLAGMAKKAAIAIAGATIAVTALTRVVTQQVSVQAQLAKSLGVSSEELENWGYLLGAIGFNGKKMVRMFKDMNNKIGGLKAGTQTFTLFQKAAHSVNLELKDLVKMDAEKQFRTILQAAKDTEDAQTGIAMATQFLGAEAGKVVGYLRTQSGTVDEILEKQAKMNLLTEEGRKGSIRFTGAMDSLEAATSSAKNQFFGLLGNALSPMVEKWLDLVAANDALLETKLAEWGDRVGRSIKWVIAQITYLITVTQKLVDYLGGLQNVLKMTGVLIASIFGAKTILLINTFIGMIKKVGIEAMIMNAKIALIPALIAGILALFFLLGEDLYQFFTGGESALGKLGEKIANFVHDNITPSIADFLGMTPEELDQHILAFGESLETFFTQTLPDFFNAFSEGTIFIFGALWDSLKLVLLAMYQDISNIFVGLGTFIGESIAATYLFFADFSKNIDSLAEQIKNFFLGVLNSFINLVQSIPNKLIQIIKSSLSGITDLISGIPFIGDAVKKFGGGNNPPPTQGAINTGAVINKSNKTSQTNNKMHANINITQQPGESGESLANRVVDIMSGEFGRAVKVTDSGVEI